MNSFTPRFRFPFIIGLAVTGAAALAQGPDPTILEGGYSEICEQAARNTGKPGSIHITGSRLAVSPVEICTLAIREDASAPGRARNYNNRGVLLFDAGSPEQALRDFDEAVRLQDSLATAHVNRGLALVAMARWDEAVAAFDRGLELGAEAEAAKAHFNRGIAHEELGHVREAYQDYLKASELDPSWEEPRRELARFRVGGN